MGRLPRKNYLKSLFGRTRLGALLYLDSQWLRSISLRPSVVSILHKLSAKFYKYDYFHRKATFIS